MKKLILMCVLATAMIGCQRADTSTSTAETECTDEIFASIDKQMQTSDSDGHGPDIGSGEWQSSVEFRLGIRGNSSVPERDSDMWCEYIQKTISNN